MIGFRNIIVHEYETADLERVYKILNEDIKDIYLLTKAKLYLC